MEAQKSAGSQTGVVPSRMKMRGMLSPKSGAISIERDSLDSEVLDQDRALSDLIWPLIRPPVQEEHVIDLRLRDEMDGQIHILWEGHSAVHS